jgi:P4 family phage/plasmid primase-like protien
MTGREPIDDYTTNDGEFPAELLQEERWFLWKYDQGRKIPRAPWKTGGDDWVSWKDAENWTDFETAEKYREKLSGYGMASCIPPYEQNSTKRLVLFDFDNCRDPETGLIHPHAWAFIVGEERESMHGALSTSGSGVHGYAWASVPEGFKVSWTHELADWDTFDAYDESPFDEPPELECYAADRFIALTGEHIDGTPHSVPDLTDTVHEMFARFGEERTVGTEREPDVSKEELDDVDTTGDVETIFDAIAHVRPGDIRLRSTVTNERADGTLSMDPSWETSESGTRLGQLDDCWLYRKGNHRLDALQVVALEERIIAEAAEYPQGSDFWDAVEALRERGAHIPELIRPNEGAGEQERPSASEADEDGTAGEEVQQTAQTDGGAQAQTATQTSPQSSSDWDDVYQAYAAAENGDDRRMPRFEATRLLCREHHWANLEENDVLYWYDPGSGVFKSKGESILRQELVDGLREQFTAHEGNEIAEQIRGRHTVTDDDLGGPEGYIAAKNCVIDLIDERTLEHSPEYRFLSSLGTEFDPDATCPRWRAFLKEVVPTDTARQKLQEFAGYTLHHWGLPYHKALFLVGPTASGKSTFLDTINAMLGEGTVASLTPQQMTAERFGGADLYGRWANIRNDIPANTVENTGQFKEIIAGDPLKAEEKFKDPFTFRPKAKHLFSANQLPEADTDDEAFFRRILLCPFPETVPRAERDPALDDKLQAELPGILNWAIEGLQRLLGNGTFTGDRSPGHTQDTWEKWGNSVKRFEKAALENGSEDIPKGVVYAAYLQYCREESVPTETQHALTRKLKQEGYSDGRAYVDGDRQRCFTGVAWTGRGEELLSAAQRDSSSGEGDTSDRDGGSPTGLSNF